MSHVVLVIVDETRSCCRLEHESLLSNRLDCEGILDRSSRRSASVSDYPRRGNLRQRVISRFVFSLGHGTISARDESWASPASPAGATR